MNKFLNKIKITYFFGVLIFLISFGIRVSAIHNIHLTNQEASYLFSLDNLGNNYSTSFLQNILIRAVFSLCGQKYLPLRIVNAFLGSLIVLSPFLFKKYLGSIGSVILAIVVSLDPFFIANSILVNGQNLVLLLASCSIAFLLKKEFSSSLFFLGLLILTGQVLGYFSIIAGTLIVYLLASKRISAKDCGKLFTHLTANFRKNLVFVLAGFLAIFVLAAFLEINLASILPDVNNFLDQTRRGYMSGSSPSAYLIALISYLPSLTIILPAGVYAGFALRSEKIKFVLFWIIISALLVFFYPGHQVIDLVWVSLPVWIAFTLLLSERLNSGIFFGKIDTIITMTLLIMIISLSFFLLSMVNRIGYGGDITGQILSIISVLTIFLAVIILYAYFLSVQSALRILLFCSLILGITLQTAIAARSAGLNHRPQFEILWDGYFPDQDIFLEIVENSRYKKTGTRSNLEAAIQSEGSDAPQWLLREAGLTERRVWITDGLANPFIITEREELGETVKSYYGQRFVRNVFPLWILSPLKNIISHDYWSWFFFRQSILLNEYNYLWIRSENEQVLH